MNDSHSRSDAIAAAEPADAVPPSEASTPINATSQQQPFQPTPLSPQTPPAPSSPVTQSPTLPPSPPADHELRVVEGRLYRETSMSHYPLPVDDFERQRISVQHELLAHFWNAQFIAPVADRLRAGDAAVLDCGCGSSMNWLLELGRMYPSTTFHGIDVEPSAVAQPSTNVHYRQHNLLKGIPFPDDTFDFIHMRLLMGSLTAIEWADIVIELTRVLKPTGWIELVESEGGLLGGGRMAQRFSQAVRTFLKQNDMPVSLSATIQSLLKDAGKLNNIRVKTNSMPLGRTAGKHSESALINCVSAFSSARPIMLPILKVSSEMYDAMLEVLIRESTTHPMYWETFRVCAQKIGTSECRQ